MKCEECGRENSEEAQFCQECGSSLVSEKNKVNTMVEREVDRRLDEKEINHIFSQIKKLSIFLGIIGALIIVFGIVMASYNPIYSAVLAVFGVLYLILAVILFTQRTKTMMLITGLITVILGFFTGLIPLLIGIALLYYYNKFSNIVKRKESY